jgi:hypothetical protein
MSIQSYKSSKIKNRDLLRFFRDAPENGLKEAQEVRCFPLVTLHVPDQDAVVLWAQSGEVRVAELHEAVEPTVNGNAGEVTCANNVAVHDPEHRGGDEPHVENVVKQQVRIVRDVVNLIA